ncbi:zinc-type alcohol dehydrogenase [Fusarium mundagurra]|uniref:Zinc-type alcohol dehydrogenase n=1 Tax=Fusarium mundagurra TaxID=1567541 RepID=A0A8H5YCV9_9HYPO|nr:zinc-type alcohol dehydrogenase [Fusarium mundagurra]
METRRVADSGLTDDEASTIPVIVLTAFITLFAPPGHGILAPFSLGAKSISLLVIGGGSNTGRAAIELAKLAGIGQIIAVAGSQNEENLRAIGATHVIDRRAPDVLDQIRAITGDELIYAVDTVNAGLDQELGVAALSNKKEGTLITLRRPDGDFDVARVGSKAAGYERRLAFGVSPIHPELTMKFWDEVPRWYKEGKLRPSSFEVIKGLDAVIVNQALDKYRYGNERQSFTRVLTRGVL